MPGTPNRPSISDTKAALATIAEIVTFLFAAFDGYLKLIAPPVSRVGGMDAAASVGFASFAALLIFLYAKVWIRASASPMGRRIWMVATGTLIAAYLGVGFQYQSVVDRHTFLFPIGQTNGTREVYGNELTDVGKQLTGAFALRNKRQPLPAELIQGAGGRIEQTLLTIWTSRSIQAAHDSLVLWYVLFVVVLATAIASLLELMLAPASEHETPPSAVRPEKAEGMDPVKAPDDALKPFVNPPLTMETKELVP
jgi:hypothetical protein